MSDFFEGIADEMEQEALWSEATYKDARAMHELDWLTVRRQIVAYGGIGESADYRWYDIPGRLCRNHGKPADLVAAEAVHPAPWGDTGDPDSMLAYLWRSWNAWQAHQQNRPRRVAVA